MEKLMKLRSKIGAAMFVVGTVIGILISILTREKKPEGRDQLPAAQEAARREKEEAIAEANEKRARALALRQQLRKRSRSRRNELLRRARRSKHGGG